MGCRIAGSNLSVVGLPTAAPILEMCGQAGAFCRSVASRRCGLMVMRSVLTDVSETLSDGDGICEH